MGNRELVSHTLPNLINGISQQSPKVRLESQSQDEVNTLHDVSRGLRKRLPTHLDMKLPSCSDDAFVHYIDKGMDGLYAVIIEDKKISAVELHSKKEVEIVGSDLSYLDVQGGLPRKEFAAVTVADATWLLNKTKVVEKDEAVIPSIKSWCAVKIRNIAPDVKYSMSLTLSGRAASHGWLSHVKLIKSFNASYTIPREITTKDAAGKITKRDPVILANENVANSLKEALAKQLGDKASDLKLTVVSNTCLLIETVKESMTLSCEVTDSVAGSYTSSFGDMQTVGDFEDLPAHFVENRVVKVKGAEDTSDDYYVKWCTDGIWHECACEGEQYRIKNTTMPWRLNLEWKENGEPFFDLVAYKWSPRECGDSTSNLFPSFVGSKCTDIFFHKNRLGLISDTNVILSESAKYQNFFVSTMRTALDTDVIDIASPTCELTELSHAVPFAKEMVMFAPKTQFVLNSSVAITAKTVSLLQAAKYENDVSIRPISVGSSLFYATKLGQTSNLWEMTVEGDSAQLTAADKAAHVPSLISGSIASLSGSTLFNKICIIGFDSGVSSVYMYSFLDSDGKRIQSAWTKWHLDYAAPVNAHFIGSKLYFVTKRDDGYYIEHTYLDADPLGTELKFVPHLDCLHEVTKDYEPVNHEVLYEDREKQRWFAGVPYRMEYEFSEQVLRVGNEGAPVSDARLQLRSIILSVKNTGEFEVEVTPIGRPTKKNHIDTRIIGGVSSILTPTPTLLTDDCKASINSNAHTVKIKIVSAVPYPLCIQAAAYKGLAMYYSTNN